MKVTLGKEMAAVVAYIDGLVGHGVPERVAVVRASRKFKQEQEYLTAVLRLVGADTHGA